MTTHSSGQTTATELAPGIRANVIVRAASTESVSDILREATESHRTVIPFGGRHSVATGNSIGPADTGLDMTGYGGIIAYEPADLTMSVRAGTMVAEIQAELGAHGQELPLDLPHPATTTVGGLVASGFAGPRRLRSGSLRDLLIGCEYVRGDGMVAKAGGMVVKNVSGFEIPRFLHGSWGSLAVLTSVNLKVTPKPRADGTVIASFVRIGEAVEAALRLIGSEPSIESCVAVREGESVTVAARAMGRPMAVSQTIASFSEALHSTTEPLESSSSQAFWQDQANQFSEADGTIVVALNARPREMAALATRLDRMLADIAGSKMVVSPGTGSLRIHAANGVDHQQRLLKEIGTLSREQNVSYIVDSAPVPLRSLIPPWGPSPEGMDLMRSVKNEFDPSGILNPGRLFV
jgi:glycolate oxidase FAD binding subunit